MERNMTKKIVCDSIEIKETMNRREIVQKIVNTFIDTEHKERGKGVQFRYPVEKLYCMEEDKLFPENTQLFIVRPGGLQKWNFDFKVDITGEMGLEKGKHTDIASDIRAKTKQNRKDIGRLLKAIEEIFNCSENDADKVLEKYADLKALFNKGAQIEIILKVLKWMFIMEDIVYWNYYGRVFLHNFLIYAANEESEERFRESLKMGKNPDKLRDFMKEANIDWVTAD